MMTRAVSWMEGERKQSERGKHQRGSAVKHVTVVDN